MSCGSTQIHQTDRFRSLRTFEVPAPFGGSGSLLTLAITRLLRLYERQQQRRTLLELDARSLADIGITREQAETEARKPFWR